MENLDIRQAARMANVPLWKIGRALGGYTDSYFSKLLRKEFSAERKQKVFEIIEELRQQKGF